ncbi:MAG: hypothetical protein A2W91_02525 [Bacteroidetes bacterium GWF2_38_335]|nr:MAG: hypothetical protein A2W91_02525 [Bacteroidetes bacterium GWF2_38_335]OFY80722.1 MAG: hypothetical protein A2281_05540 [Bacteroidetes bacterium RIFOXYA12_FULL_38_20]HBS87069.1 hypothetical protein [Bacteroidales bacterium]
MGMKINILLVLITITIVSNSQDTIRSITPDMDSIEYFRNPFKIINAWLPNKNQVIFNGNGFLENINNEEIQRVYYRNGVIENLSLSFDSTKTKLLEIGTYVDSSKRNNTWFGFYENGQIQWKVQYDNGKIVSDFTEFYENAQIKAIYSVVDNLGHLNKKGAYKEYYESGKLRFEGQYFYGKCKCELDSTTLEFQMAVPLRQDTKSGKWIEYYENGNIKKHFNI